MERTVKITEEDRNNIERLHYQVEARANLIERLLGGITKAENSDKVLSKYLEEYDAYYTKYIKFKEYLETKYKPEDVKDTAKSWEIIFESCEMIFEV